MTKAQLEDKWSQRDSGGELWLDTKCHVMLVSTRMGDPSLFFFLLDLTCAIKKPKKQQNKPDKKPTKQRNRTGKKMSSAENESIPWNPAGEPSALLMELSGFHHDSSVSYSSLSAEGRCGFTGNTGPCSLWVFKAWAIILNWKQRQRYYYKIV